jgi:hypothetical protein
VLGEILPAVVLASAVAVAAPYTPPNQVLVTAAVTTTFDQQTGLYRYDYVFRNDPTSALEVATILIPLSGAAVERVTAPAGWTTDHSTLNDVLGFDATEVVLPADYVDDGSIPPSPYQIKQGQSLGGFSIVSPDGPGTISFHVQGFTQLPVLGVDVEEDDGPGVRPPGPLDATQSFRGSTTGPVRGTSQTIALRYYLHGEGAVANPPTLLLDAIVPTWPSAKRKDSEALAFDTGNPWQALGTWTTRGALPDGSLRTAGDLHVWLSLKDLADERAAFDVRAELATNGVVIGAGTRQCVRSLQFPVPKDVAIPVTVSSPTAFAPGDRLDLTLLTRIGTNSDGSRCGTRNTARGLRAHFDAADHAAGLRLTFEP